MLEAASRLRRAYGDLFAALYAWNRARWPSDQLWAAHLTALGIGGAMLMNLLWPVFGFVMLKGAPYEEGAVPGGATMLMIAVCAAVLLGNDQFVARGLYTHAVQRFEKRAPADQRKVAVWAWTWVTASYASPWLFAVAFAVVPP